MSQVTISHKSPLVAHERGIQIENHHLAQIKWPTLEAGIRHATGVHTWRRTRARAIWIRRSAALVSSSSARHTVGAEAT